VQLSVQFERHDSKGKLKVAVQLATLSHEPAELAQSVIIRAKLTYADLAAFASEFRALIDGKIEEATLRSWS
jgi:hypothetical protein